MSTAKRFIEAEPLLATRRLAGQLGRLPLRRAIAPRAGQFLSRARGRGVEFDESRAYQPGDDIRLMDWRVTARTNEAHTRVLREERERPILVVLDQSPGMLFGSRRQLKLTLAARMAALLGWMAVAHGDRIGGLIVGAKSQHALRPAGGRRGVMRWVHALTTQVGPPACRQENSLQQELEQLSRLARPGSEIWLLSDFWQLDEGLAESIGRLRAHQEVILCPVHDRLEAEPPPSGNYPLRTTLESLGVDGWLALGRRGERQRYRQRFLEHAEALDHMARRFGLRQLPLRTDLALQKQLLELWRRQHGAQLGQLFEVA
jgi:uncharacterized protein (DUF58 family)